MKLALVALLLVAVMLGVALVVTARRGAEKNDREHLVGR